MKQKLKVVHVEDRFHPLMGYQINFFAKHHSPNIDFHIVTSDSVSIWKDTTANINLKEVDKAFETDYNCTIHRLVAYQSNSQKSNLWIRGLSRFVNNLHPDVIYLHGIESYSTLRLLIKLYFSKKRTRVFADTHTLYNQFENNLKFKLHLATVRLLTRNLLVLNNAKVFATTNENMQILINEYKLPQQNTEYLPIGTDSSQFYYDETERNKLRSALGIDSSELVLLYSGKINDKKKPHLIINAIEKIAEKITCKLHLLFIGPKSEPYFTDNFKLTSLTNQKNLSVQFIDTIDNSLLYQFYSMADFAVFPKENTLSALDAQACRLPVIMEKNITNIARLESGGLVFNENDIIDLGKKILMLLNDKNLRSKLSIEGQQFVLENYEYKRIIRKLENMLII